jgi:hypothetical protein
VSDTEEWVISGAAMRAIDDAKREYDQRLFGLAQKIATVRGRRDYSGMRLIAADDVRAAISMIAATAE